MNVEITDTAGSHCGGASIIFLKDVLRHSDRRDGTLLIGLEAQRCVAVDLTPCRKPAAPGRYGQSGLLPPTRRALGRGMDLPPRPPTLIWKPRHVRRKRRSRIVTVHND